MSNDTADRASLKRRIAQKFGIQSDIAILGDGAGRIYDNTNRGYVYIRVLNSVSDTGVPIYTAPFTVRHNPNAQYKVADGTRVRLFIDRDGELAIEGADFTGMIAANQNPAIFNSGTPETKFINPSRLTTLMSFAIGNGSTPTLKIGVQALLYITSGTTFQFFAGAQYDFTANVPATSGKKALAVVYLDTTTNALGSVVGSDKDAILNFDTADYTEVVGLIPLTALPSGMWVLTNGMTTITEKQLQLDLRQWMNLPASTSIDRVPLWLIKW